LTERLFCGKVTKDPGVLLQLFNTFGASSAVWPSEDSPILASGDVAVEQLLAVEAGLRVLFAAGASLTVTGALLAEGRPDASIEFGSQQNTLACAPWLGVKIMEGSRGALLRYVWLVGATIALTVVGAAPVVVEKCAFDDWETAAVQYDAAVALTIRQTTFGLSSDSASGVPTAPSPAVVTGTGATAAIIIEHCVFGGRFADAPAAAISPGPTIRANTFQYDAVTACAASAGLTINEIVAGQTRLITDRRGDFEDYIELFNPSDSELVSIQACKHCDNHNTIPRELSDQRLLG
jgi:hypothetical protein